MTPFGQLEIARAVLAHAPMVKLVHWMGALNPEERAVLSRLIFDERNELRSRGAIDPEALFRCFAETPALWKRLDDEVERVVTAAADAAQRMIKDRAAEPKEARDNSQQDSP